MEKRTILLVDDEKIIRDTASSMIKELGYNCITAGSGREGIEKFKKYHSDILVLLLDVEMPDIKGNEVGDMLKKEFSNINILYTSGYERDYLEKKVFGKKIENFIPKPLSAKELSLKFEQFSEKQNVQ